MKFVFIAPEIGFCDIPDLKKSQWCDVLFLRFFIHDTPLKIKSCTGAMTLFSDEICTHKTIPMFIEHIHIHVTTKFRITRIMNRTIEPNYFIVFMNFRSFSMGFDCLIYFNLGFNWFQTLKIIGFIHLRCIYVDSERFVGYDYVI